MAVLRMILSAMSAGFACIIQTMDIIGTVVPK